MSIAALVERAHLPLVALLLVAGIGLAAGSRDLMKRLLGAGVAVLAAIAHLVVVTGGAAGLDGAVLGAIVLALAATALGCIVLVRIREAFGSLDSSVVRAGVEDDALRAAQDV